MFRFSSMVASASSSGLRRNAEARRTTCAVESRQRFGGKVAKRRHSRPRGFGRALRGGGEEFQVRLYWSFSHGVTKTRRQASRKAAETWSLCWWVGDYDNPLEAPRAHKRSAFSAALREARQTRDLKLASNREAPPRHPPRLRASRTSALRRRPEQIASATIVAGLSRGYGAEPRFQKRI